MLIKISHGFYFDLSDILYTDYAPSINYPNQAAIKIYTKSLGKLPIIIDSMSDTKPETFLKKLDEYLGIENENNSGN